MVKWAILSGLSGLRWLRREVLRRLMTYRRIAGAGLALQRVSGTGY